MSRYATLRAMAGAKPEVDRGDPRYVLGQLVRQLMARDRLDRGELAARAGIGRTTLWRLIIGDPNVTVETISAVEQALDQPFGLFAFVIERNLAAIERLPALDENFRSWIIGALSTQPDAKGKKTASPRKRTA